MYPPPAESLDAQTVRALDDQFFTSDPFSYIRCRMSALLMDTTDQASLSSTALPSTEMAMQFAALLGPAATQYVKPDARVRNLQVAVDAFALRHQVAENLLRLLHVVLHHQEGHSFWVELTDTPTRNADVCKANHAALVGEGVDPDALLRDALGFPKPVDKLTSQLPSATSISEHSITPDLAEATFGIHVAWINYAIALFVQKNPDLDAAHNKFKHGMGLRPQHDLVSTLIRVPLDDPRNVPLSALIGDDAIDLFDGITVDFLARATRRSGLELTQIAMSPAATLVEAAAMAHTLALLFNSAASAHFHDHDPEQGRSIAPHPGLMADGPRPGTLRTLGPFALRFPLSTPLRDGHDDLPLLFSTDGGIKTVTFGQAVRGVIVDDTPP